ncbi:LacI family DNA-binding transcriptional regulator [Cellulomonas marina]|uniref:DNA-binding transcriptional regulator, LacI/PurR family n=1 Tax=Cellulomonas marina TaxID=988821 RepID=A0A1I0W616_9CELL|nr:LacI family DNA-binding transcriptional regulator [Cellulomonas marina]SFA83758.1 DNA-binding transcriptional regulator, LacI/PurR family [Cellulomonas marina]
MAVVTSADVARASGVSRTTVSYVLNGTPGTTISAATRARVLEAAERLGYAPSAAARTLRRGRSDLVVVVLPHWPIGPVVDALLDRLTTDLAERGLSVLVHHGRGRRPLADLWRHVSPRAVVGLAPFDPAELDAMRRAGITPVGALVGRDGRDPAPDPAAYAGAQEGIGRLQAEHLLGRGRSRLAYAAPADERLAGFAAQRLAGVRAACAAAGAAHPLVAEVPPDPDAAAEVCRVWAAAGVDGVLAYNDEVALAVLAGLRAVGARVPEDVAVVGVDDEPAARLAVPPLSTVQQEIEVEADHLAAVTLATLDGRAVPPHPPTSVRLVVRGSS